MYYAHIGGLLVFGALVATTTLANAADDNAAAAKPKKSAKAPKQNKPTTKAEKVEPKQDVAASDPAPEPKPEPKPEPAKAAEAPKSEAKATAVIDTGKPSSSDPAADKHNDSELSEGAKEAAERPISIAPTVGFATNNLNLGFGLRGGYTIPLKNGNGVYLGGQFMYHLGYSNESSFLGKTYGSSISVLYPSFEAGYDIRFNRLVVRPYGGIGLMVVNFSSSGLSGNSSALAGGLSYNALAFYPGCQVSYDIPSTRIFVGGDARVLLAASGGVGASFGIFGTGGVRF